MSDCGRPLDIATDITTIEQLIQVALSITETLAIIHSKGLIHRDIKVRKYFFEPHREPQLKHQLANQHYCQGKHDFYYRL